ncbi:MAG: cobyrinic acid a,c-diamide synthase [Desulfobulbaceae bacterium A2]|nr:MAG: cobyrinic acid a,c-diamide synthase [Desulfobulbaceae bacterium A2]
MGIIAVYSIKGGVGKTAAAVNLAHLAAQEGGRTLLCDLDAQGSSSYYFRVRPAKKYDSSSLLKGGREIEDNIRGTDFANLDLLPADLSYRHLDIELEGLKKSRKRLRRVLEPLEGVYDWIVLDCPPNITLLAENIFRAADLILVPFVPTTLSQLARAQLLDFLAGQELAQDKVLFFFSLVERRKRMHQEVMAGFTGDAAVLNSGIPYLADVERMGIFRQPVTAALPDSPAAEAYRALWRELRQRLPQD